MYKVTTTTFINGLKAYQLEQWVSKKGAWRFCFSTMDAEFFQVYLRKAKIRSKITEKMEIVE